MIGVVLLIGFLIASYRAICSGPRSSSSLVSLACAVWTVLVFYNMTEAAFMGGLLWMMLLLGIVAVPKRTKDRVRALNAPALAENAVMEPSPSLFNNYGSQTQPERVMSRLSRQRKDN